LPYEKKDKICFVGAFPSTATALAWVGLFFTLPVRSVDDVKVQRGWLIA